MIHNVSVGSRSGADCFVECIQIVRMMEAELWVFTFLWKV